MTKITNLWIKIFILLLSCLVIPLITFMFVIKYYMENVIQDQICDQAIQVMVKNKQFISDELEDLASYSNIFVYDEEMRDRISSSETSELDNIKYLQKLIERTEISDPRGIGRYAKIIIFDNYGRVYSNWALNYQNYTNLLQLNWVQESMHNNGHLSWSIFEPAYILEDTEKDSEDRYISFARSLMSGITTGEQIGTLIVSIDQSVFGNLLTEYQYDQDSVYVCIGEGQLLMRKDGAVVADETAIRALASECSEMAGKLKTSVSGKPVLMSYYTIPHPWVFNGQEMKVYQLTDYQNIQDKVNSFTRRANECIILLIPLMILASLVISRIIVNPIKKLTTQMESYQVGTVTEIHTSERRDEIGHLQNAFCSMTENINSLFEKLKKENEIKEQYHYESLRAQLNPHFLFNTLNTIRWMAIIQGAGNIVDAIDALAYLLKYSMSRDKQLVTVRDELDHIKNYIYIHNIRYQDFATLNIDVPDKICRLKTLKFILQPIVENAVLHGNSDSILITVRASIKDDKTLLIHVEDNGVGLPQELMHNFEENREQKYKNSKMTGIGLTNVDTLIRIQFGENYGLRLGNTPEHGARVTFVLPVIEGETIEAIEKDTDCG